MTRPPVCLRLTDVSKRFGSLSVLDRVSLELRGGEIHALLGENGAGKTTLMNIVYGLLSMDGGSMELDGAAVAPRSPNEARRLGIGMVHQHFTVVAQLTTAENLALGLDDGIVFDPEAAGAEALRLAARFGLDIGDPQIKLRALSVGARQRIEILKALAGEVRILVLDEPTAVLTPQEVGQLFTVLDRLRSEGVLVVLITHKLREVRAIADRVSVLRRGRVVATVAPAEVSDSDLAALMIGEPLVDAERERRARGPSLLRLEGVGLGTVTEPPGVAFDVRAGEIFGVVGVDGNGQQELFEVLAGLRAPAKGNVLVAGRPVTRFTPAALQAAGVSVIPPDRRSEGLVLGMTGAENLVLNRALLRRHARRGLLQSAAIRDFAEEQADRYSIRRSALTAPAATLSGGNQQRLVVARTLATRPAVLVAVNPTRGLDVAASRAVYAAIDEFAGAGGAVLLVSTDLDEVLTASDRVAVLYRRRLSEPFGPPYPLDRIGLAMATGESS